jgi:hypothetical protein
MGSVTTMRQLETEVPAMYKLRAEYLGDVLGFLTQVAKTKQGLMNVHISPLREPDSGDKTLPTGETVPRWSVNICDVVVSFGTYASKETLARILENGEDWHVMAATIAEESQYTGIRTLDGTFSTPPTREYTMDELQARM